MPTVKANFHLKNDPVVRRFGEEREVFERTLLEKGGLEGSITLFIQTKGLVTS